MKEQYSVWAKKALKQAEKIAINPYYILKILRNKAKKLHF